MPEMSRIRRLAPIVTALLGLALAIYLIIHAGAEDVAQAMLVVGWGLVPITLFHFFPLLLSALSWRALLPGASRLDVFDATWIRWIRESINTLLPSAGVGGDVVSARLAHLRGVPQTLAAASMIVDVTVGAATQLLFAMTGVVLLLAYATDPTMLRVAWLFGGGIAIVSLATAVFVAAQHRGMLAGLTKLAGGLLGLDRASGMAGSASAVDAAVVQLYGDRAAFYRANLVRLAGWAIGGGEIWLVMQFLGQPISLAEAFILDSLGAGVRAAAFMVPGQLGILESGFVVFGALFGVPPDSALAISLSRRVRELALGVPGLCLWQWVEGRRLRHRGRVG
jgi:putative membrane protein